MAKTRTSKRLNLNTNNESNNGDSSGPSTSRSKRGKGARSATKHTPSTKSVATSPIHKAKVSVINRETSPMQIQTRDVATSPVIFDSMNENGAQAAPENADAIEADEPPAEPEPGPSTSRRASGCKKSPARLNDRQLNVLVQAEIRNRLKIAQSKGNKRATKTRNVMKLFKDAPRCARCTEMSMTFRPKSAILTTVVLVLQAAVDNPARFNFRRRRSFNLQPYTSPPIGLTQAPLDTEDILCCEVAQRESDFLEKIITISRYYTAILNVVIEFDPQPYYEVIDACDDNRPPPSRTIARAVDRLGMHLTDDDVKSLYEAITQRFFRQVNIEVVNFVQNRFQFVEEEA